MSVLAVPLSHWIFLTCRLYARQDPDAQEYDRAHHDPVRGHVHQLRAISQPADHDHETHCIKPKRHNDSFFESAAEVFTP